MSKKKTIQVETTKVRQLEKLEDKFRRASLGESMDLRDILVCYTGNPDAEIALVGEAPGEDEEKKGQPFVGTAGSLLKDALLECGITKKQVYITNVLKFRPASKKVGENRPPKWREIRPFRKLLLEELKVVKPKVVLCLGGSALRAVLNEEDLKIGKEINSVYELGEMLVVGVYHPSYIVRCGGADTYAYRILIETLKWAKNRTNLKPNRVPKMHPGAQNHE